MNILIMGAGALGSVFGGFLRLAGHRVALVGRQKHIEAISRSGLKISGLWGDYTAHGLIAAEKVSDFTGTVFDLVFLSVKSQDTLEAAVQFTPYLSREGIAISLQNGLGNAEILAGQVGEDRAAAARVIFGAEITGPGSVQVTVCADSVLAGKAVPGPNPVLDHKIREAVSALKQTKIPTEWVEDVHPYLWAKTVYNSALNPLGALLEVNYGKLADNPYTRDIMDRIITEVFAVAGAKGVKMPWNSPEAYITDFYGRLIPLTAEHRPSMLQDLERGRRTEIDALNGRIVWYGNDLGVPTPVNEFVTKLIKAKEGVTSRVI